MCCALKYQIFRQDIVLFTLKKQACLWFIFMQIHFLLLISGKILCVPRNCFKLNSSLCIFSISFLWAYIQWKKYKFFSNKAYVKSLRSPDLFLDSFNRTLESCFSSRSLTYLISGYWAPTQVKDGFHLMKWP